MHPTSLAPPAALLTELCDVHTGSQSRLEEVLERYGLRPLTGGFQNGVYAWDEPDRGPICLKLYTKGNHRRRVEREWAALTLLAQHEISDVPRPLWLDDDHSVPTIGTSLIAGTPIIESSGREVALKGLAHTTRHLQSVPLSGLLADIERIDSGTHYMKRLTGGWIALLPDLGVTPANRHQFLAAQRTCALRWLAILWK